MYRIALTLVFVSVFMLSFTKQMKPALLRVLVLEGVVTDQDHKPLQKAHLFTVLGEEEALTDKEGRFSFKTAQPLPVKLTVQLQDYEEKAIELSVAPRSLAIELKRK